MINLNFLLFSLSLSLSLLSVPSLSHYSLPPPPALSFCSYILLLFPSANPEQSHLSRMQSIRRSFRQSLKRLNVRQSMRGMQSIRRSYRPNFVRSNSMRPSMKNKAHGGVGGASVVGGRASVRASSAAGSAEVTPVPVRRDSIRQISFVAPCHIAGETFHKSLALCTEDVGIYNPILARTLFTILCSVKSHTCTKLPIVGKCCRLAH